ncbi:ActS/PrrB/RegB family redox-sensitive histidine kinase [Asticcacaulis machinosus]|uniref:histidine kinase n=1 Tax=Asticcacaulis machinosus TaxID=2984211 RepID=A0ABT5HLN2_9CAUL|nr:ActS/PrrB/RegB family redox-sensitive histidine kinase [Asticcacaulis machinosus]MDC7676913.1 ActS/PrrB/RegB family redox-sensitive histidine kinase [Asticcacaulis machinosus]
MDFSQTFKRIGLDFKALNVAEAPPLGGREHLRLRTLVFLRWLAIFGQTLMVVLVAFGFGYEINLTLCLSIIAASVWLNALLMLGGRSRSQLKDWEAAVQLGFDTLQLAALLGVTGGLSNPFCLMLVAPPTVAAANLPTRHGVAVICVALLASMSLFFWSLDLPWPEGQSLYLPPMYRLGFLFALLIGIVFTAGYAWQAALEARRMEQALEATRAVMEKEHRLSALGGLAAAAAHELGTPLGTIQVVAKEMMLALKPDDPLHEDAALLVSQSQRCRDILKTLSQKPETVDQVYDQMPLRAFLEEIAEPFQHFGKTIHIDIMVEDGMPEAITIKRRPEWLHAVSAFVENAVDFAASQVWIRVEVFDAYVALSVEDDGPGFAPEILSRLGEPYVSTRHSDVKAQLRHNPGGMGLGFFIAKTLCEYSGARLSFGNRDEGGAQVKAMWRRDQMQISGIEP